MRIARADARTLRISVACGRNVGTFGGYHAAWRGEHRTRGSIGAASHLECHRDT
jgi:hypothetical protein